MSASRQTTVEPFEIHVDDAVLDDLHERLARARLPDQIPGTGWEYGMPADYLAELVAYWRDDVRLARAGSAAQPFAQFRTEIDGQTIHFVHARSRHVDARAAAPHARLARIDRRVPRRDPSPRRSRGATAVTPRTRSTWWSRRSPATDSPARRPRRVGTRTASPARSPR